MAQSYFDRDIMNVILDGLNSYIERDSHVLVTQAALPQA